MIHKAMTRKVFGQVEGAAKRAAGVARHVAWYLAYQMDGTARPQTPGKLRD